jgi:hypothetical protein
MGCALHHPEQAPLHDLARRRFQVNQDKQEPIFRCRQGTVLVDGKPARGPRLPIHPPRRHPGVERRLEGRDQLLKLVERQAREIQELYRAGLQRGEPSTSHGACLLSRSRDIRGASYQKESGINSNVRCLGLAVHAAVPGAIGGLCVLPASCLLRLNSAFSQSFAVYALAVPAASWPPPP